MGIAYVKAMSAIRATRRERMIGVLREEWENEWCRRYVRLSFSNPSRGTAVKAVCCYTCVPAHFSKVAKQIQTEKGQQ
jgi:hypothetical protein